MGGVSFYPQSLLPLNKQLKLGNPVFPRREIADWSSPFAFQKNPHKFSVITINSDGSTRGGPPYKGSAAGSNGSSSNQDEIISLFRRIQSSISEEEPVGKKKRNPSSSKGKTRDKLGGASPAKDGAINIRKRDVPKKEQELQNDEPVADFKLTRLPSNFVKRSPIPFPSTLRGKILEVKNETEASSAGKAGKEHLELSRVEELKLPELKELAKARGIRGYSRLKKSELVKLLRS